MSKFELKDGQGSMFRNDRKESETHADWKGTLKLDGKEYWVNCWEKKGKNGDFFSLSVKPKEKNLGQALKKVREQPKGKPEFDDDIGW